MQIFFFFFLEAFEDIFAFDCAYETFFPPDFDLNLLIQILFFFFAIVFKFHHE